MEGLPWETRGAPLMSGNRMKKMKISENYVEMNVMFWYSIVVGRWRGDILEIIFGEIPFSKSEGGLWDSKRG